MPESVPVPVSDGTTKPGCWTCEKNLHPNGVHPSYYCKPDLCPDRAKHAGSVYGDRLTERIGHMSRDGVTTIVQIDGVDAHKNYRQERCICGLWLIWSPKEASRA